MGNHHLPITGRTGLGGTGSPVQPCSPVCWLWALCCPCAVSWSTLLLSPGLLARCFVLCVRYHGILGSCSPGCLLGVLCRMVVSRVRCPGSLNCCEPPCLLGVLCRVSGVLEKFGSCLPVCPLSGLSCVCGVLGHWAPVNRSAPTVLCDVCAVSWATWLLFTGVPARWVVSRVRCPEPLGTCSSVRWLGVLCPLGGLCRHCGVLGLVFTRWVVLRMRSPGPLGFCSPVCWLGALCCVCGSLGRLAPVRRCACSVCCGACAVSWASRFLFTGVLARCVALRVCGVVGHLAPVHRSARSVHCVARAVSWATWLLSPGVLAPGFILCVPRP